LRRKFNIVTTFLISFKIQNNRWRSSAHSRLVILPLEKGEELRHKFAIVAGARLLILV